MRTIRKLVPGQDGTKKLVKQYGEDLVCVRYRYDEEQKIRAKTIELIIEKTPWQRNSQRIPMNKIVRVRIDYGEIELGRIVKSVGGRWNRKEKGWELAYKDVVALGITDRIIQDKE